MKNIVLTVVMFAVAAALVVGVILPLATHGKETGTNVETKMDSIDTNLTTLEATIR
jgi:hypothetical protein